MKQRILQGELPEVGEGRRKIAGVLESRSELKKVLRIRCKEELPVCERLGTVAICWCRAYLALNLLAHNGPGDRDVAELLRKLHAAAERMRIPAAGQIREIKDREGF